MPKIICRGNANVVMSIFGTYCRKLSQFVAMTVILAAQAAVDSNLVDFLHL